MREEGAEASNGRVERNDAVTEGLVVGGGLRNERRGGVLKLLSLLHHSSYFFLQFLCRFRFTHLFSSLLFDFLLSFFFFNSLEILTTDSYCNSNWRLAERPRNRQLYKNTKYTQSQREENEPKKKKEKGICFCYSLTVTHLFQFSRTLSHSFCSFWLWEREIHILLKLVLEPESRGRYHYPQLLFISTSLVHFTNKQTGIWRVKL